MLNGCGYYGTWQSVFVIFERVYCVKFENNRYGRTTGVGRFRATAWKGTLLFYSNSAIFLFKSVQWTARRHYPQLHAVEKRRVKWRRSQPKVEAWRAGGICVCISDIEAATSENRKKEIWKNYRALLGAVKSSRSDVVRRRSHLSMLSDEMLDHRNRLSVTDWIL